MVGIFWIGFISFIILSFVVYSIFSNGEEYVEDVEYHSVSTRGYGKKRVERFVTKSKPKVKDKPMVKNKSISVKSSVKDKPIKSKTENVSKSSIKDRITESKPIDEVKVGEIKDIHKGKEFGDTTFGDIKGVVKKPKKTPVESNEDSYRIDVPEDIDLEPKQINKTLSSPIEIYKSEDNPIVDEIEKIIDEDMQSDSGEEIPKVEKIPDQKQLPKSKEHRSKDPNPGANKSDKPKSDKPNPKPRNGGLGLMN